MQRRTGGSRRLGRSSRSSGSSGSGESSGWKERTMNLAGKRILLVGGAGLVGSHIVDQLVAEPVSEVVVFDNFVRGTRDNLAQAQKSSKVRIVEGSMTDRDAIRRALDGVGGVFLLASLWLGE